MLASLPQEEAEKARPEVEKLHSQLALLAEGVALKPTRQRSGKQQNRQSKRTDTAKKVHALFPARRNNGKRARAPEVEVSDPLPKLRQKDEGSKKVRVVAAGCRRGRVLHWGAGRDGRLQRLTPSSSTHDVMFPALPHSTAASPRRATRRAP